MLALYIRESVSILRVVIPHKHYHTELAKCLCSARYSRDTVEIQPPGERAEEECVRPQVDPGPLL